VLSQVLGHHVVIVGSMLPSYLLPVMVTVRLSAANTAYFYTTWMVGTIFFVISPAVSASLFVEGVHGTGRLSATAVASGRIIAGMLLPIMAVFLLGGPLILGLFGPNYAHHGESLLLALILSAVPDAITNVYVAVLRVQRRFREAATLNLGMAALVLVLAWFLLPVWGVAGAGWAWLIAQALGSVWVALRLGLARIRPETRTPLRQGAERSG
jgi:O-antigen/teichoic acid export membrane protein